MTLSVIGLSHHSSPVEVRERMAIPEGQLPEVLSALKQRIPGAGCVVVNTCNRVEIYVRAEGDPLQVKENVLDFLAEWHKIAREEFLPHMYAHTDREAAMHLFRVTASLDSLVVGEEQILGQIHDAYHLAQSVGATEKILSGLFQRAFKTAKEVRTKTNINNGRVSVASVAVDLAVSIFMELHDKCAMLIGSGEMSELALKHLIGRGIGRIIVVNRTVDKARELANAYHGEAVALSEINSKLHEADILITSTAAEEPILGVADFQQALKKRSKKPMFVIDIAVPRDIHPSVNELDNVYLYDIDDLRKVADENMELRRQEIERCMEIVEQQVESFMKWRNSLYAEPTIVSMSQELHTIREREVEKTMAALGHLSEKDREEIENMSRRIVNTILQRPMTQLKEEVHREDPGRVLHLVKRLFGLEEGGT